MQNNRTEPLLVRLLMGLLGLASLVCGWFDRLSPLEQAPELIKKCSTSVVEVSKLLSVRWKCDKREMSEIAERLGSGWSVADGLFTIKRLFCLGSYWLAIASSEETCSFTEDIRDRVVEPQSHQPSPLLLSFFLHPPPILPASLFP